MATSGTVSTTVFRTQQVIDHAMRRCKLTAAQITSEHLSIAQDLLYLFLSALSNEGIKLWNVDRTILPLYEAFFSVPTPVGTVDVLDCNLRTSQRITGTASSTSGTAANAFDGNLATNCTLAAPAGSITMQLATAYAIPQFGILPNASGTWDFSFQYSDDGISWTTIFSKTAVTVVAGTWLWYDQEGVAAHLYYRLLGGATTTLDVRELVYQNQPVEIPLALLSRTDYMNLPNKTFQGRPTQFWYDKDRVQPVLTLWPAVQAQFTFSQIIATLHRHIQDVGTLAQELELPQRWFMAAVSSLAAQLAREIKEVDAALVPSLDADAAGDLISAWKGETDRAPARFLPNIRPYTR